MPNRKTTKRKGAKTSATSSASGRERSPKRRSQGGPKRSSKPKASKTGDGSSSDRKNSRTTSKSAAKPGLGPQRLNKILAAAGLGSRREVEELIVQGRVEVDRDIVTDLAFKADPREVAIKVDGQKLKPFRPVYFILNKPKGVLSTNKDPSGRARVIDFVPDNERVFSVGRLDKSSEGLMLLTNDGELAQRLAHPKFRVQKTYFVVVSGQMTIEELNKLKKGIYLSEGFARIDGATIRKQRRQSTELEIVLSEGKNREIRRLLARAGHKVVTLRRIAIGPLRLAQLPVGAARLLTPTEVRELYEITFTSKKRTAKKASKKSIPSKGKATSEITNDNYKPASHAQVTSFDDDDMDDEVASPPPFMIEDDEYDDDFIGDFSGLGTQGSVLSFDDEPSGSTTKNPRKSRKKVSPKGKSSKSRATRFGDSRGGNTRGSRGTKGVKSSKKGNSKRPTAKKPATGGNPKPKGGNPKPKKGGGPKTSKGVRGRNTKSKAGSTKGRRR